MTIDVLPDDVLLDIFDFCLDQPRRLILDRTKVWQGLVHVCRRCRVVVFQSPHRLDLQILCTTGTPVREMLDTWPALPLVILVDTDSLRRGMENIIAALEHRDRMCTISIRHASRASLK